MKSRSPIILAIIIILLVLGWMFSDDFLNRETKNSFNDNSSISNTNSENEANNIVVSAKRVKNNLISKTIRSNAVSYPEFEISLPSEVEGIISRLFAKEGDFVSEGDKILEVDKGTLDQKITAAKAAFTASKKALDVAQKTLNGTLSEELQAARASLKLAQQDLDIVKKLFEQNFASSLEVTQKASVVENAQVKIATLENQQNYNLELNLINSEADFQNAKTYLMDLNRELNNMIILSPANGIIEKLYLDKGERITKNSVVGNILGMENIKLISKISQNEINNINIGDAAIVKYKDRSLFGKVSKIASTANTTTRTFDVEIIVKNKGLFLKGGMTLEIEITTDNILAYEMSPVHLSVNSDGVLYTKIVKNEHVIYKNVTIVNSGENLVNVTGLNDGDIVLTNGQAFVSLNDKIQYNIEN